MVFERELHLPCDPLFGAPPDMKQSVTNYVVDHEDQLYDIHHFARQHLKVASNRMKAHFDHLANPTGFKKGDKVWLYCLTWTRRKSPKLQPSWEGQINDEVHQIQ
jgi:hypothetical protein